MNRVRGRAAGIVVGTATIPAPESMSLRLDAPSPIALAVIAKRGDVLAGVSSDEQVRVWDATTGALHSTIDMHGRQAAWLNLSPDSQLLLVADYARRVTISSLASSEVAWEFTPQHYLVAGAFSPDNRLLAVAPGSPVQLYNVDSHRLLRQLDTTIGTLAVAFSRNGAMLASADGDAIRIFDVQSGVLIATNTECAAAPLAVAFSADDRSVVAGGGDRVLLLIDATDGRTIQQSVELSDPIMYLETSPDGSSVAVVTQHVDDPQRPAPVVLATLPDLTVVQAWLPATGVIMPGGAWGADGHFRVVTQSGPALHLWTVR